MSLFLHISVKGAYDYQLSMFDIRYRVPKIIAITITSLQLIQMIVGCAVNYIAFSYKQNGRKIHVKKDSLK